MNLKRLLTVLLLLCILGLVLFLPSLIDNPSHQKGETVSYPVCNLNEGECHYQSSLFGDISISVSPSEFTALVPLKVTLTNTQRLITGAMISLDGKDMFMGVNQTLMGQQGSRGSWQGVITIPVCTVDADMEWLFSVTLIGPEPERLVFNIKSKH